MNNYIYVGNDQVAGPLQLEKPEIPIAMNEQEEKSLLYGYEIKLREYESNIASLPRIDIVGEHSFLDGQILEIGKDIQIDRWYGNRFRAVITTSDYSLSAIPLKQVQKEKDFEPEVHSTNKDSLATLACTSGNNIEQTIEAIKKVTKEACKSKESALQFLKDAGIINDEFMPIKWVNAVDRLPVLPNPLPANTDDERGVLFVNRVHSSCFFWYPSYGRESSATLASCAASGEGWELDKWEWLEELAASQEVKGNATQQGWISVKDRLPEKPGLYIVGGHTYRELSADGFWRVATFSTYSKEPCFFGMDSFVDYPTHWLVLPPLPEKPNSE